MLATRFIFVPLIASIANGLENVQPSKRQDPDITPVLNSTEILRFKPYTYFASAAYCNSIATSNWTCGAICEANSDFILVTVGYKDDFALFWYVGFSPSLETVIVGHQGTKFLLDSDNIIASIQDLNAFLTPLDSSLFPNVDSSVEVHSGFANDQAQTANDVLLAVQTTIVAYNATLVTVVGHSLGGAIGLLDVVYLSLNLHIDNLSFKVITFGMPRVGNQQFADYIDDHFNVTHINNKEDSVPILPPTSLGYHHPSGEVHIMDNDDWVSCPGQDNPSSNCSAGDVNINILDQILFGDPDHDGPYGGITMGVGC